MENIAGLNLGMKKKMVGDSPTEPENAPHAMTLSKPCLGRYEPNKLRP